MKLVLLKGAGTIFCATIILCACKKNTSNTNIQPAEPPIIPEPLGVIKSDFSLNWNSRTNSTTYTQAQAEADFGNVIGWNDSRAFITNGKDNTNGCRVTLLPNALSGAGGMITDIDVSDGSAYEMDYDVKFHSQFHWSRGGKVGFGFKIGDGNTGCDPATDGNGGSLRLMWYSPNSDPARVFFQPYVYHKDMAGTCGDTYTARYPSSGALQKGVWYHVHMYIKSNTGTNRDGHAQILINGTPILDTDIRWTTNDTKRLVRRLTFHTFRGGSESYWTASTTDYIYYDNLTVNKIN
ncbi:MAG TPA: hypothetical protein VEB42_02045 [Chitinophagaceae bacterium]|nr:hypothetical protein [Chitinophagaceae bacterium]